MPYRAPVDDIMNVMIHAAGLEAVLAMDGAGTDLASVRAIIEEAGRFATDRCAPLNRPGDREGARITPEGVSTPAGWKELYRDWAAGGWNGVCAPAEYGGMELPLMVGSACIEVWNAANMAFSLAPLLAQGAVEALDRHGTEELKKRYLPKLVSGEWTGTMNLTEPQAGSDLNALRCRAERAGDGTYRIRGQKIYITYGDHDMAGNIVHLVLARLPDAPPGTRGISLFLVPKFIPAADGTPGARNDLRCHAIEHKMGVHASPTCTMIYGDNEGAVGWLIGEENRGLACMFTMMNNARLSVGVQGVGLAEAACQQALAYAQDRRQGAARGEQMAPIAAHPDVKRMLATMQSLTQAARAICHLTAAALDEARLSPDPLRREAAQRRAGLLTPVAKAFATDAANETVSLNVQIHGGIGFVEDAGAAQLFRDTRIAAIYEGTNGIQAIDLVQRKLPLDGGATVAAEIAAMRDALAEAAPLASAGLAGSLARIAAAIDAFEMATAYMHGVLGAAPDDALCGATPYLRLFALARGGTSLMTLALRAGPAHAPQARALARFFADNMAVAAPGLAVAVTEGAPSVHLFPEAAA